MNKRATGKSTPGAPAIAAFLTTCLQLVAPLPAAAQTIDQLMSHRVKLESVPINHSTQYSSFPDFDFARLRKESPEK